MRLLGWEEFCKQGPRAYKSACTNCKYLLSLGGRTVIEYDCFPVEMMHETIRKMKENKVKTGRDHSFCLLTSAETSY